MIARTVLAVDGGNSKTDVALVAEGGRLVGAVRGPTISHQAVGLDEGMRRLVRLADGATAAAGAAGDTGEGASAPVMPEIGVFALAGADFASDVRLLRAAIGRQGIVGTADVVNDSLAALRAGTRRSWGIALICGQGINGLGVAPDGRTARFHGVGDISGDWGGGGSVGLAGQAAAVRGTDGRGPRTSLERLVPAHFGLRTPGALVQALYTGRIPGERIGELSPVVFAAAVDGDAVARSIADRLADELGAMAGALIRRLRLARTAPDVVLAGGVFRTDDRTFHGRLGDVIHSHAPAARLLRLEAPPVLGAALLGIERLTGRTAHGEEAARLESDLRRWASRSGPAGSPLS